MTVLLIFLGLVRHGKATAVAEELGMTQSSISHALKRLRGVFDDPVFLRRPHGLQPTQLALDIVPYVEEAVSRLDQALSLGQSFDPVTSHAVLRISALDYEVVLLMSDLLKHLDRFAPGIRLSVQSLGRKEAFAALLGRQIDLAIGYFWKAPDGLITEPLFEETYAVAVKKDHPDFAAGMSLSGYLAARHIVISTDGSLWGIVDRTLARDGQSRQVVAALPQFLSALGVVAETNLIVTLPRRIALSQAARFGLRVLDPPMTIRSFDLSMAFRTSDSSNKQLEWVRNQLRAQIKASGA